MFITILLGILFTKASGYSFQESFSGTFYPGGGYQVEEKVGNQEYYYSNPGYGSGGGSNSGPREFHLSQSFPQSNVQTNERVSYGGQPYNYQYSYPSYQPYYYPQSYYQQYYYPYQYYPAAAAYGAPIPPQSSSTPASTVSTPASTAGGSSTPASSTGSEFMLHYIT
ncbi:hypothetical protein AVEN_166353-1 [Araneus ventricosus]|uniref:Uncharacterized protein n=1 Tax=Araneus ventricosus TaxID=182803 RepID=A0A4Y2QMS8_ARAVE|nr:hypothetical protein AVEN_166353-1 [Araneus ventricosus]